MQVNFYSADASSLLELAEIKFRSEKSFCLAKNCAYNVRFFDDPFDFKSSVYNVLYRKCLGCSRKCALPVNYLVLIMLIALASFLAIMRFKLLLTVILGTCHLITLMV